MDQSGKCRRKRHKEEKLFLVELEKYEIPDVMERLRKILNPMFEKAKLEASQWAEAKIKKAALHAEKELNVEYERIKALYEVNPFISDEEVSYAKAKIDKVTAHIKNRASLMASGSYFVSND